MMTHHIFSSSRPARRSVLWFLALFTVLIAAPVLLAGEDNPLISVDLVDADMSMVLKALMDSSRANIVMDSSVANKRVTCTMYDMPLETVLDALAKTNGLYWCKENGIYRISAQPPAAANPPAAPAEPAAPAVSVGAIDLAPQT
ncbi:MAG: hypothetical protein QHJ73_19675, partial [Armatimonadota bacterium]|nr:hypothetical protein [Armatimonadota bacterium]